MRAAEEASLGLLLYERSDDPLVRADLEADLRRRLSQLEPSLQGVDEARAIAAAVSHTDAYFSAATGEDDGDAAAVVGARDGLFAALQDLVDINVRQARSVERQVAAWDMKRSSRSSAASLTTSGTP